MYKINSNIVNLLHKIIKDTKEVEQIVSMIELDVGIHEYSKLVERINNEKPKTNTK